MDSGRESINMPDRLRALLGLFLRLGATAFGGPAAHIAMLRDEVVERREWLDDDRFLDLLGATNLIPGPNSTEMALHIGYIHAGLPGLLVAGFSFILPAAAIVGVLAWGYVRFGSTPQMEWLLYGVKPVAIALVAKALWVLGRRAFKSTPLLLVGLASFSLYFVGTDELLLLFGGALGYILYRAVRQTITLTPMMILPLSKAWSVPWTARPLDLSILFLTFLKIGSVLYGSGYVLLAFLHSDLVGRLGWLTDRQLIDAVAIGQVTPGPVFTTSTFIGYLLGGLPGAILATLGIFLPSFIFVTLTNPLVARMRESTWAQHLLDGVNVSALGLMAAVTILLARLAYVDLWTVILGAAALIAVFRSRINPSILVLTGAMLGWMVSWLS